MDIDEKARKNQKLSFQMPSSIARNYLEGQDHEPKSAQTDSPHNYVDVLLPDAAQLPLACIRTP